MARLTRAKEIAKAVEEGKPLPPVNYAKAVRGNLIHPLRAWTDGSDRVYVAFASAKQNFVASFSRADLARLTKVEMLKPLVLHYDPTLPTRVLFALLTRNVLPSGWLKEIEETEGSS